MTTLALDLGSTTGWALGDRNGRFSSGSLELLPAKQVREQAKTGMDRRCDGRVLALARWLDAKLAENQVERVVFEDVLFVHSAKQAQLWSSFRATVWVTCAITRPVRLDLHCIPVATIKKFFTGYGGAEKIHMAQALLDGKKGFAGEFVIGPNKRGDTDLLEASSGRSVDDNEVDALAILAYAQHVDAGKTQWPYEQ